MGKVQARHIHPSINQSAQHLFAIARRPYSRYDLRPFRRSTHLSILAEGHAEDKGEPYRRVGSDLYDPCDLYDLYAATPYAMRRRKNQVASVNVNTAMTAIGQMFANTSAAGKLFRKSPLT